MKIDDLYIQEVELITLTIISFLLAMIFTILIIKYSYKLGMVDKPSHRKIHLIPTPSLGGVAIVTGLCISSLFYIDGNTEITFLLIIVTTFILSLLGAYDDIKNASPVLRLFVEAVMVLVLVFFADLSIYPVFLFLGLTELNALLDLVLTTIFCVAMINAFNFIDGINGLLGSIFTINFIALALGFFYTGYFELGILSALTAMAIPGFLIFNFFKAKIFLGDSGSIALGFLNTVLVLYLLDHTTRIEVWDFRFDAVDFIALLVLPGVDMLKVIVSRVLEGNSPMKADNTHLHHLLLKVNNSHLKSTLIIVSYHIVTILLTLVMVNVSIGLMLGVLSLYMVLIYVITKVSFEKAAFFKVWFGQNI